jgi:hypothetical protein
MDCQSSPCHLARQPPLFARLVPGWRLVGVGQRDVLELERGATMGRVDRDDEAKRRDLAIGIAARHPGANQNRQPRRLSQETLPRLAVGSEELLGDDEPSCLAIVANAGWQGKLAVS